MTTLVRKVVSAAALAAVCSLPAQAAVVQITMQGVNFQFFEGGGGVCDAGGGVGCFANADALTSMQFFVDGVLQGGLVANIGLNLLLQLPGAVNPTVNGATQLLDVGFDVFDAQINGAPGLFTDVTGGSVTFGNQGTSFAAGGTATRFGAAALPFGILGPDSTLGWTLNGTGACTGAPGDRTCVYSGIAQMFWNTAAVPEPQTLLLAATAVMALAAVPRRRRRAAV
jgi:hypothetical protein